VGLVPKHTMVTTGRQEKETGKLKQEKTQ